MKVAHPIIDGSSGHLRDFIGFEKHMAQIRAKRGDSVPEAWYDHPFYYEICLEQEKMRQSGETLRFPSYVTKKDYEFEIVGKFLEPIKTTDIRTAIEHVARKMQFCIFNDASCRDFQARDMMLPLGVSNSKGIADKSFGPFCAYGHELHMDKNGVFDIWMQMWINGELYTDTNFNTIYFYDPRTGEKKNWSFAEAIVFMGRMNQGFSEGALIGSGTVGDGSIAEHIGEKNKKGNVIEWLKGSDVICMQVEGLGELKNRIEVIQMPDPLQIYR